MHWKTKATLQNAVSRLPSRSSYATYYWLQRHFGGLRRINPIARLRAGIQTWMQIEKLGRDPFNKIFFEVGTGRVPMTPLAYWLMGANSVITIDLNPYMKAELTKECLEYIADHEEDVQELFGPLLIRKRFEALLYFQRQDDFELQSLLDLCRIVYIAPGDAAKTGLGPDAIDFHTSFNVFEHIPHNVLLAILAEGNRIVRSGGLFVHRVDYSDHFSHSDTRISPINFLQYSDTQWDRYAGNRYMYMNRLRHDDFLALFESARHTILATEPTIDASALQLLREGRLNVDARFGGKAIDVLATTESWIVSAKAGLALV
jgi:SAM-dependent methyltransferase